MSEAMPLSSSHSLLVVILNYRTPGLTIDCLRSLQGEVQSLPGTGVVVVDNGSGDGSVEQIQGAIEDEAWGDWASILPSDYNGGFAFGNNLAIRPALASPHPPAYFLLLNPDTQAQPNTLRALVDFMERHPQAGIAGSNSEDETGKLWSMAFRFPTILSELDAGLRFGPVSKLLSNWTILRPMPDEDCQVDWLQGACLLIRREVFEAIGLLDEGYFLYYEETDFCLRAKRAGWSCWYVPESRIVHLVGQSSGFTLYGPRQRRPQYWFDSRRRYFVKNHGLLYAALADLAWIAGFALWRLRRVIQRKPDNDPPQLLGDSIRNSVFCQGSSFLKKET